VEVGSTERGGHPGDGATRDATPIDQPAREVEHARMRPLGRSRRVGYEGDNHSDADHESGEDRRKSWDTHPTGHGGGLKPGPPPQFGTGPQASRLGIVNTAPVLGRCEVAQKSCPAESSAAR
jgi:hypothetical protein